MKFGDIPQFMSDGNYEVNMPLDFLVENIEKWQGEDDLQLYPDFQRGRVWTPEQQVAWLEFFFQGGKTGRILYFNAPWWGHFNKSKNPYKDFVLVDGLQRLTSLMGFLKGNIAIFGGHRIADFEDRPRMARAGDNLRLNVNSLKTKAEVLTWYIQMNEGGTPHTEQDIARVRNLLAECKEEKG